MNSKLPPVPDANRSSKGTGSSPTPESVLPSRDAAENPDKIGQQGNSKVNTTGQGYQQDR